MDEKDFLTDIEPLCILRLLVRNIWMLILAAMIASMSVSIVFNMMVSKYYTCSATFVVNSRAVSSFQSANISAAYEVAETYSQMLQSQVAKQILEEHLNYPVSSSITASQLGETNLLVVNVSADTPKEALDVIHTIINHHAEFSGYSSSSAVLHLLNVPTISSRTSVGFNQASISRTAKICSVGLMAMMIILISLSRRTIHTSSAAKRYLDAKIITSVPHERRPLLRFLPSLLPLQLYKGKRLPTNLNISSPTTSFVFSEAIHRIAFTFEHQHSKGKQVFLFSSVSAAEGKSTLAGNTALSLAQKNGSVLFLDLDLRRPVQSQLLGLSVDEGRELGQLLLSGKTASDILDSVVTDKNTGLATLLSSKSYTEMIELISSPTLADTIALARERFDYIIIDSPPLGYFADSEILSDLSDASILVVRQDRVPAPEVNDAIDALRSGKAEFLGCILNDMLHLFSQTSNYGYGLNYGYKYGKYNSYTKQPLQATQHQTRAK